MALDPAPLHQSILDGLDGGSAYWARSKDGTRVRFAHWPGGARHMLILPGRAEYIEKYARVVRRLAALDFSVTTLDWRGQGLSDRVASAGHVERYLDYHNDMMAVLDAAQSIAPKGAPHMIAHSMGGLIGLGALERGFSPSSAMFSGPMWGLGLAGAALPLLGAGARLAALMRLGAGRIPGTNPGSYIASADPEDNALVASAETARWLQDQMRRVPELVVGGPSWGWLKASMDEIARLRSFELPDVPSLTVMGSAESVVNTEAIHARTRHGRSGRFHILEGAKHEVLLETGAMQEELWTILRAFWT